MSEQPKLTRVGKKPSACEAKGERGAKLTKNLRERKRHISKKENEGATQPEGGEGRNKRTEDIKKSGCRGGRKRRRKWQR